jgi:hypothetical protein
MQAYCVLTSVHVVRVFVRDAGEYPLSSTLTFEFSASNQLRNVAMVFSMQGLGAMFSPILILILLQFTKNKETIWRLAFGFSVLPCIALIWPRYKMKETREFRIMQRRQKGVATIEEEAEGQAHDDRVAARERESLVSSRDGRDRAGFQQLGALPTPTPSGYSVTRMLIGTSVIWFLFDVAFYANSMFNTSILSTMGLGNGDLSQLTLLTFYLTLMALPGYFIGVFLVQGQSLFWIQVIGFALLTMLYTLMALVKLQNLSPAVLMLVYGFTFLVSNAGPNLTTYVIPVTLFPTKDRMYYHGISAAAGKLGALVGTAALKPVLESYGVSWVLGICAACSFLGLIVTFICIPRKPGGTGNSSAASNAHGPAAGPIIGVPGTTNKQI